MEHRERCVIGDVHAVHVTCSSWTFQNSLQDVLQRVIKEDLTSGGFRVCPPSPHLAARNNVLMRRTFLRRQTCILKDQLDYDTELDEIAERFLAKWNGDWTFPGIQHCCSGPSCCSGPDDCANQMFGLAVQLDLLLSRDSGTPSLDDWNSCGECCGKIGLGIVCHGILERVISIGLPNPSNQLHGDGPENSGERARRRARKKAWRSKYFLRDNTRKMRMLLVCFVAVHVERLISELQHRDANAKGILDVLSEGPLNPFWECRRKLLEELRAGRSGDLGRLFDYFEPAMHYAMQSELRAIVLDLVSQVQWRFLALDTFPIKLLGMVHPAWDTRRRQAPARQPFALKPCCMDPFFFAKVRAAFSDEDALFSDLDFRKMLLTVAYVYKFCNM